MGYECLLTGLPALSADGTAPMTMEQLLDILNETLLPNDQPLLDVLRCDATSPVIDEQMTIYDDDLLKQPAWWEDAREMLSDLDVRMALVYDRGMHCTNRFLRAWFSYNMDLNNVLVATICRRHNMDVSRAIVGDNEVARMLRKDLPQKDFGLVGIMDDWAEVMALVDEENLMAREKKMDALRFSWLEDNTRFINFSIENVLAYWLEMQMLCRWAMLTVEDGEKAFRTIVADMKKGADELLK